MFKYLYFYISVTAYTLGFIYTKVLDKICGLLFHYYKKTEMLLGLKCKEYLSVIDTVFHD